MRLIDTAGMVVLGLLSAQVSSAAWTPQPATPGDPMVAVTLVDSSVLEGKIDASTDDAQLVLRWETAGSRIARTLAWSRVASVRVADQTLTPTAFRQLLAAVREAAPLVARDEAAWKARWSAALLAPRPPAPPAMATPRVTSLSIDAALAHFGPNVNHDGLSLEVAPLDAAGQIVPVQGTLEVELYGEAVGVVTPANPFGVIGRWTQIVRADDFGPRGAVVRLPYQAVHPEFASRLAPVGAVHARLTVPGHGSFESTQPSVRLRPYSSVRDRLELSTGYRYFYGERLAEHD